MIMRYARTALFCGLICLLAIFDTGCRKEEISDAMPDPEAQRVALEARFAEFDAKAAELPHEPIETNEDGMYVLKDVNFMEAVNEGGILVVDFWMDDCYPCEDMEPIIKGLARQYKDQVRFAKLHTNTNMIMPEKYGVQMLPSFAFFVDGKYLGLLTGAQSPERMRMAIDKTLIDHHAKQDELHPEN